MALWPKYIEREQKKIPQITKSWLIVWKKQISNDPCFKEYVATLKTTLNDIKFNYFVPQWYCTYDGIMERVAYNHLQKWSFISVNLTKKVPHSLVSYKEHYTPNSYYLFYILTIILLALILFYKKFYYSKQCCENKDF